MRNVHRALTYLGFGSVVMGAAIHGIACAKTAEDCNLLGEVCSVLPSATGTGTGGSDGNPICEQDPVTNPDALSEECGYFVKAGAGAMGDGTKANPYGDLQSALAVAGSGTEKKRVYVCQGDFSESIVVQAGVSLYGGFDCTADWAAPAADARTTLKSPPDVVPIVFESSDAKATSHIEGFAVTAASASMTGGSSIAAIARNGAVVDIKNCSFTAGNGANGDVGTDAPPMAPASPLNGVNGANVCASTTENDGGPQGVSNCDELLMHFSIGGQGGAGRVLNGGDGETGSVMPAPAEPLGIGGKGQQSCSGNGLGKTGADGEQGMPGVAGVSIGTLSPTGWEGASGADGQKGNPGQGGGGGGGQKGKLNCAGASGGAGGAGGCGGAGGGGGKAGGSSIAFVSINATIKMEGVKLTAAKGGDGGIGGAAQSGAMGAGGGNGGNNTADATLIAGCKGGSGGKGGEGGPGGGGAGGHSLGIAYIGEIPEALPMITVGEKGIGGGGGNGNLKGNKGADGVAESKLEFTATSSN